MTRQVAIEILKKEKSYMLGNGGNNQAEAFDMAIEALEQPSDVEDLIKQVSEQERWLSVAGYNAYNVDIAFKSIVRAIQALPSVTPTHCIAEVKFSKEDLREICNERIEIECTHGTCKDCKHYYIDEDGCGYHCERDDCTRFSVYADFYCKEFKKRGSEE